MAAAQVRQPALQIAERLNCSRVLRLFAVCGDFGADFGLSHGGGRGLRFEEFLVHRVGVAAIDVVAVVAGEAQQPQNDDQHGQHPDEARRGPP